MSRSKHCTVDQRNLIVRLRNEGRTYQFVSQFVGCSQNMVTNALKQNQLKKHEEGDEKHQLEPIVTLFVCRKRIHFSHQ